MGWVRKGSFALRCARTGSCGCREGTEGREKEISCCRAGVGRSGAAVSRLGLDSTHRLNSCPLECAAVTESALGGEGRRERGDALSRLVRGGVGEGGER